MRLINSYTLELEEFSGEGIPEYAILSHTWVKGQEVTFQEFPDQKEKAKKGGRNKSGWDKISSTVRLAREDNLQYVWIDTCCIDKTSSAELTEAINSMMGWYEHSQVCYTYLEDVSSGLGQGYREDTFRASRWFTRGWTLQELLAPSKLVFVYDDWKRFATRDEMAGMVGSITGIDVSFLRAPEGDAESGGFSANAISMTSRNSLRERLNSASIAKRMSWASKRLTERVEDKAYCLLGIFDINMPLVYGEGPKAFLRLQEHIMMNSDDQSILAWNHEGLETEGSGKKPVFVDVFQGKTVKRTEYTGLFASSPDAFSTCQNIERINIGKPALHSLITNRGLRLELRIGSFKNCPCAFLQCRDKYAPTNVVALPLRLTPEEFYVRPRAPLRLADHRLLLNTRPMELYALNHGEYTPGPKTGKGYTVMIRNLPKGFKILRSWSDSGNMGPYSQIIIEDDGRHDRFLGGALLLGNPSGKARLLLVVVSRRTETKGVQAICALVDPDRLDGDYLVEWASRSAASWQNTNHFSENLFTILRKARPTIRTADGIYSTTAILPDSYGKSLMCVDINITSTRLDDIVRFMLPWRTVLLWFRNHMRGHEGSKKFLLLLVLIPRAVTTGVELLTRKVLKATANPRYMLPLVTIYTFVVAGNPPRFLASALGRARRRSSETLKGWAFVSMLIYLSCNLVGSDAALEVLKKLLAKKKK